LIRLPELAVNLPFDFPEDASKLFDLAMKQLKLGDIDGAASVLSRSLEIEERPATFFELAKLKFQE
jgi:hypothetical protein